MLEPRFLGVGFNLLPELDAWDFGPVTQQIFDEVYGKRLKELRPGWARMGLCGAGAQPVPPQGAASLDDARTHYHVRTGQRARDMRSEDMRRPQYRPF